MVAAQHTKNPACIWIYSLFGLFDPRPVNSDRNIVLALTRYCTSVTTDALPVVDDKTVLHCFRLLKKGA